MRVKIQSFCLIHCWIKIVSEDFNFLFQNGLVIVSEIDPDSPNGNGFVYHLHLIAWIVIAIVVQIATVFVILFVLVSHFVSGCAIGVAVVSGFEGIDS